jgi:hypothetical protein
VGRALKKLREKEEDGVKAPLLLLFSFSAGLSVAVKI